jgi:putative transposase
MEVYARLNRATRNLSVRLETLRDIAKPCETPCDEADMSDEDPRLGTGDGFPQQHRTKLHSTNPIERLNKEVKRRADVVGIFPNEEAITRLIGALLSEQNDEWQTQHRYMQVEAFSQTDQSSTDPLLSIQMQAT